MNTLAISLLAISKPALLWSAIALFIIAAFIVRIVDSMSTMKRINKAIEARKAMRVVKPSDAAEQEMKQIA